MKIIAFGHKAGVGKTTAANILVTELEAKKMAFADPLKEAAKAIFRFTPEQLYGRTKEVRDPFWAISPREVLQKLGTEAVRGTFGDDVWVRALERRLEELPTNSIVTIDDVRFVSEAKALRELGAYLFRVDRTCLPSPYGTHSSETALNGYLGWDAVIINDKSEEEFRENVLTTVRPYLRDAPATTAERQKLSGW